MENEFRKLFRHLFTKPKALLIRKEEGDGDTEPIIRSHPQTPDELALGWAEGKDEETGKEVFQLKAVPQAHRDAHFYVVGATRSGKTKFLESLIEQDIKNDVGFGVIDPHGDLTEEIKGYLYVLKKDTLEELKERVVFIDPTDETRTVAFNPLEGIAGAGSKRTHRSVQENLARRLGRADGTSFEKYSDCARGK